MYKSELAGERFSELRKKSGFTQSQLAEYLQVDQSYISKCEKNERKLSLDVLEKVANLFGCPVDYFINENSNYSPLPTAFRADAVETQDLEVIAELNKIALNLRFMEELLEGVENDGED